MFAGRKQPVVSQLYAQTWTFGAQGGVTRVGNRLAMFASHTPVQALRGLWDGRLVSAHRDGTQANDERKFDKVIVWG